MTLRNTQARYGWMSQWLHWLMAVALLALYGLGLWFDELSYYDTLYQTIPHIHESLGVVVFGVLGFRFLWRLASTEPDCGDLSPLERRGAKIVHWGFYPLIAAIVLSGYLISTADGRAVAVFDWFELPALIHGRHQEDIAGEVHEVLSDVFLAVVAVHALAALKHHFIDGGDSLRRMLPSFGRDD